MNDLAMLCHYIGHKDHVYCYDKTANIDGMLLYITQNGIRKEHKGGNAISSIHNRGGNYHVVIMIVNQKRRNNSEDLSGETEALYSINTKKEEVVSKNTLGRDSSPTDTSSFNMSIAI